MGVRERRQGDPFPGAAEYNEIVRAVRRVNALTLGAANSPLGIATSERVVVRNESSTEIPRLGIVEIYEPVFGPTDNLNEFVSRVSLRGRVPTAAARGRIAIALEPLPEARVGLAVVSGMAICKLNVTDANATFAKDVPGNATRLETSTVGAIPIIWKESGASGEKWAVVLLGAQGMNPRRFRRRLAITAAVSAGTNVWDYTVLVDGASMPAENLYEETPWGHGQGLSFTQGDLTPGPVEGSVWCDLRDDGVWEFDEPNPLVPACAE